LPLALSVCLLAVGVLLLVPSWLARVSLVANVVACESKLRIEETHLREAHGAALEAYCRQAGCYLPPLSSPRADKPVPVEWSHSRGGDR
jgi:protein-S-isoprenylcysteine O-methyltransferase Ste14